MIVYSTSTSGSFIAMPGEHIVYGKNEQEPQGFGQVSATNTGKLTVNGISLDTLSRKYPWVRKV